jgi:hypothetical protein
MFFVSVRPAFSSSLFGSLFGFTCSGMRLLAIRTFSIRVRWCRLRCAVRVGVRLVVAHICRVLSIPSRSFVWRCFVRLAVHHFTHANFVGSRSDAGLAFCLRAGWRA